MAFAQAYYPKNKTTRFVDIFAYALTAIVILMVVSQLMTIEKFLPMIENYQLVGGFSTAKIVTFLLATCGIFGLPFLLRMKLSPLFRVFSALLLNIYGLLWLYLAFWVLTTRPPLIGTGILGGVLDIPQNVLLPFAIVLEVACVLVTWFLRKDLTINKLSKNKKAR